MAPTLMKKKDKIERGRVALKVQRENERQVFWDGNNICIKKKNKL